MTETMVFRPVPVMKPRKEADHCTAFSVAATSGEFGKIHRDKVVNDCHDTGHILSRRRPVYYRYNSDAGFSAYFLRRCTCVDHCDVFGSENDTALIIYIGVYMQVYTMMSYRRFTHTVIPTESSEWRNLSREHP